MKFSVLLSVYHKEKEDFLFASLDSLMKQSLIPSEIVIIQDGPLTPELLTVIDSFAKRNQSLFNIVKLKKNMGLGKALNIGIKECSYDLIARMDSDDVASPDRFEKQIAFMKKNKSIDVLGSNIYEFDNSYKEPTGSRVVPEYHDEIRDFCKWKNPMNHMTVVMRKSSVLQSGNYKHFPGFEDYHLWVRMIQNRFKFHNIQDKLVFARIGNDMIGRRHGYSYLRFELDFIHWMYKSNFIGLIDKYKMSTVRTAVRLIPKSLTKLLYKKINRGK